MGQAPASITSLLKTKDIMRIGHTRVNGLVYLKLMGLQGLPCVPGERKITAYRDSLRDVTGYLI
jgi:hypothetical protein